MSIESDVLEFLQKARDSTAPWVTAHHVGVALRSVAYEENRCDEAWSRRQVSAAVQRLKRKGKIISDGNAFRAAS